MKSKWPQYHGSSKKTEDRAKSLRRESTSAEKLFWQVVRNRNVKDLKFRRQHPIGSFIVDFYCDEAKLVIELDGEVHEVEEVKLYDRKRHAAIVEKGLTILRFTNEEVFSDPDRIIKKIEEYVDGKK